MSAYWLSLCEKILDFLKISRITPHSQPLMIEQFLIRQFMNSLSESFSFWQKQIQLRLKSDYCTITNNTLPVSISWRSRSYQSLSHGNSVLYVIFKNALPFVKFQLKFEHQNFISSTEGQRAKAFLIFSNCCLTVTTTSGLYVEQDRDMNSPPFHQIAA